MNTQNTGIMVNKIEYQKMILPHLYINDEYMHILLRRSIKCVNKLTELFSSTSTEQSSRDVPVKSTSESQKHMASQHKLIIQKDKNSCESNGLNSTVVVRSPKISGITVHKNSPQHTITQAESKSSSGKILQNQSVNSKNTRMIPLNRTAADTSDRSKRAYRNQYKRAQHSNENNKCETIQNNQFLWDDKLKSKQIVVTSSPQNRPAKEAIKIRVNDLHEIENPNIINSLFSTLDVSMKRNINDDDFETIRKKSKVISHEEYQSVQTEHASSSHHKYPSGQAIHNISDNTSLSQCHEKIINHDYVSMDSDVEIIEVEEEIIVISSDDDENQKW